MSEHDEEWEDDMAYVFFCGITIGFALGALLVGILWWLL